MVNRKQRANGEFNLLSIITHEDDNIAMHWIAALEYKKTYILYWVMMLHRKR